MRVKSKGSALKDKPAKRPSTSSSSAPTSPASVLDQPARFEIGPDEFVTDLAEHATGYAPSRVASASPDASTVLGWNGGRVLARRGEHLYTTRVKLKMRVGSDLDSDPRGELPADSRVIVRERRTLPDGTRRAEVVEKVAEGAPAARVGWISCVGKDGRDTISAAEPNKPSPEFAKEAVREIIEGADLLRQRQEDNRAAGAKAEALAAKRALAAARKEASASQSDAAAAAAAEAEASRAHIASGRAWRKASEQEAVARRRAADLERDVLHEERLGVSEAWREEHAPWEPQTEWRATLEASRVRAAAAKEEAAGMAKLTAVQQDAHEKVEARVRARVAESAAAQARAAAARESLSLTTRRLTTCNKKVASAEQAAVHAACGPRLGAPSPGQSRTMLDEARSRLAAASSMGIEAAVKPLVMASSVGCLGWREAEVQVLLDRKEQRRAEIHALNSLLRAALSDNDPRV